MKTPLRILLAGGSGLMGEPSARALRAAGHAVTVLTRGRRPVRPFAEALVADRTDESSLAKVLRARSFDLTVDFAGYTDSDVSRLLDIAGFSAGRYVLISTGQVYLVAKERRPPFVEADGVLPAMSEPVRETRAWHNWVYGMGKRAAEAELQRRREYRGLEAISLRLPVVQGAGDPSRRLWAYLQRLLDGGPLLLPDGGAHPVRFVWAEDVARAIVALAARDQWRVAACNLAMPDEPTLGDLVRRMAVCLGVQAHTVACTEAQLAAEGLDPAFSPYSGPWCSRPDPTLGQRELEMSCTPTDGWLAEVVRAHLAERDPQPHPGYAGRATELELARRLS